MSSKNVQRDNDFSLPLNDDVMRDEFDDHEAEFERWKNRLDPYFQASLIALSAALVGRERAKDFREATLYEAFLWTLEVQESPSLD